MKRMVINPEYFFPCVFLIIFDRERPLSVPEVELTIRNKRSTAE